MKAKTGFLVTLISGILLVGSESHAAVVISTWSGGSGALAWENSGNWTPDVAGKPYPNNGTDTYQANVSNTAGNLNLSTGGAITVSRLQLAQVSSGSLALSLGGNFTLAATPASGALTASSFSNATTDPSKLILNLNGHNFTVLGADTLYSGIATADNYTITGGGVFSIGRINSGTGIVVGANTTVKLTSAVDIQNVTATWHATSTLQIAGARATANAAANITGTIGNLVIGDTANSMRTLAKLDVPITRVAGNVTMLASTTGEYSRIEFDPDAAEESLYVGGNFTDEGADASSYGAGSLIFNGGSAVEKQVLINRTGLVSHFQFGESAAISSNIRLGADLATTGSTTIWNNSRVNLDSFTLKTGALNVRSDASSRPTLAFTIGEDVGFFDVTGLLTLNGFNVELNWDGSSWIDGSDLLLFHYGSLSGTPNLINVFAAEGITYGTLFNDGAGNIYLTNVVVPEPGSLALVFIGALGVVSRRSFRSRTIRS